MKIAFLITSSGWGGLEMNTIKLAKSLVKLNYEITLFTQKNATIIDKKEDIFSSTVFIERNRKYFDFWECCFAPANITFTTKKSINLNKNNFSPCFSHDAFQQCVYFYLEKHDNFNSDQYNRDIIDNSIEFSGDTPEPKNYEEIVKINKELYEKSKDPKNPIKLSDVLESIYANSNIKKGEKVVVLTNQCRGVLLRPNFINTLSPEQKAAFERGDFLFDKATYLTGIDETLVNVIRTRSGKGNMNNQQQANQQQANQQKANQQKANQ